MLLVACLCIGGWVRGLTGLPSCYTIVSQRNTLRLMRTSEIEMLRVEETTGLTSRASFKMPRHKIFTTLVVPANLSLTLGPNTDERKSLHLALPPSAVALPFSLFAAWF